MTDATLVSAVRTVGDDQRHYEFDVDNEDGISPCQALVGAMCEFRGVSAEELDPLANWVDPESVDALFGSEGRDTVESAARELQFVYDGYNVRLNSDGDIKILP